MIGRWLFAAMLLWSAHAAAQAPSVSLAASDPPLSERLGAYQALYLRFTYKSDRPIQIEAQGLHQNQRLPAMSGGIAASPAGEGDAMTWIAFKAGTEIDELKIIVRDDKWRELSSFRVPAQVRWETGVHRPDSARADWVSRLQHERDARKRQQLDASAGYDWIGFIIFASVPLYFIVQAWLAIAWDGRWRIAALVPVAVMAPAVAWSLVALSQGSNLWPIWVILLAPFALAYLGLLRTTRKLVAFARA